MVLKWLAVGRMDKFGLALEGVGVGARVEIHVGVFFCLLASAVVGQAEC